MGFKILLLFLKKEVNRKEKDNSSGHIWQVEQRQEEAKGTHCFKKMFYYLPFNNEKRKENENRKLMTFYLKFSLTESHTEGKFCT
jgi:hypothetical protein